MSHDEPKILNLGDLLREADRQREAAQAARTIDAFDRASDLDAKKITDLRADIAEVTKQRDEFAEHIATRERNDVRDGACDLCFPNAPTKTGYVCIRHRAEAVVAGRRA